MKIEIPIQGMFLICVLIILLSVSSCERDRINKIDEKFKAASKKEY